MFQLDISELGVDSNSLADLAEPQDAELSGNSSPAVTILTNDPAVFCADVANKTNNIIDRDFKLSIRYQLFTLSRVPREKLYYGPTFEIASPLGKLNIEVVFYHGVGGVILDRAEWNNPENLKDLRYEDYHLFIKNEKGEIVAYKTCHLEYGASKPHEAIATTNIEIGLRGKGLAIPIELSFIELLQRIANYSQRQIKWVVTNQNLEKLAKLKKNLHPSIEEQTTIASLELEQTRWQKIYGMGGKLGIDMEDNVEDVQMGQKVLDPDPNSDRVNIDSIGKISLERVGDEQFSEAKARVVYLIKKNNLDNVGTDELLRKAA